MLSFSLALTVVPKASATPTAWLSRSLIFTMVNGSHSLPPAEEGAIRTVDNFIGNTTANDGYVATNLCGTGTTKQNILDYTADAETNYARVAVFHFGHFAESMYLTFQDDNSVAVHYMI